jgi:hypothetical protein
VLGGEDCKVALLLVDWILKPLMNGLITQLLWMGYGVTEWTDGRMNECVVDWFLKDWMD